jgi:hypothetical protein
VEEQEQIDWSSHLKSSLKAKGVQAALRAGMPRKKRTEKAKALPAIEEGSPGRI